MGKKKEEKTVSPCAAAITLQIIVYCCPLKPPGVQRSLRPSFSDRVKMKKEILRRGIRARDVCVCVCEREREIMVIRRQRQIHVLKGR